MSFRRYILNLVLPLVLILAGADLLVLLATERLETARFRERYLIGQSDILTAYLADDPEQTGKTSPAWDELERIQAYWSNFMTGFRAAVYPLERSQPPLLQYGQIAQLPPDAWLLDSFPPNGRILPVGGFFGEKALHLREITVGGASALLVIEGSNPWHAFADIDFWTRTARLYLFVALGAAFIIFIFVQFIGGEIRRMQEKLLGFAESYKRLPTDTDANAFRLKDLADLSDTVDHLSEAFLSVEESSSCLFLDVASTISENDSAERFLRDNGWTDSLDLGSWQVATATQLEDPRTFAWLRQTPSGFFFCSGKIDTNLAPLELSRSLVAFMQLVWGHRTHLQSERISTACQLFDLREVSICLADFKINQVELLRDSEDASRSAISRISLDPPPSAPIILLHPQSGQGPNPLMLESLSQLAPSAMAKALLASSTSKTKVDSCLILRFTSPAAEPSAREL